MTCPLPPYLKREKLTSGLLMAFKRHMPFYTGIRRRRLEVQIKLMEGYLKEMKADPAMNYETKIRFDGVYYQ